MTVDPAPQPSVSVPTVSLQASEMILPTVSVVVPVFDDKARLRVLLDCLSLQIDGGRFEILVADNEGSPEVADLVSCVPRAAYVCETKRGSYAARNAALSRARGEIIAFTDSDCLPDPRWIYEGTKAFVGQPNLSIAGGRIQVFPAQPGNPNFWECIDLASAFRQDAMISKGGVAVTANLWVRHSVFREVGGFNDSLQSGGDTEWCRRAAAKGFSTRYLASAIVSHPARASRSEHRKKVKRVVEGLYARNCQRPDIYPIKRVLLDCLIPPAGTFRRACRSAAVPRQKLFGLVAALSDLYLYRIWCWGRCLLR